MSSPWWQWFNRSQQIESESEDENEQPSQNRKTLDEERWEWYNKLLDIINQLKQFGHNVAVELPQIIVVGAQSAGKSCLIEKLAQFRFLPSGTNMQTRCPIVLQLIRSKNGKTWVEFLNIPEKSFFDMEKVKEEIEKINKNIGNDISDTPISLKVYSPDLINLTLVDLPGLRFAPRPDDPEDTKLSAQIEKLVQSYMKQQTSIILAVVPASNELVNEPSINLIEKADPSRTRTALVLTKLDLVKKTPMVDSVTKTLKGEGKRIFKLGHFAVLTRGDNEDGSPMTASQGTQLERKIQREEFPHLSDQIGIQFLTTQIRNELMERVKALMPSVRGVISEQIRLFEHKLESLGGLDNTKARLQPISFITKFGEEYRGQIDGEKTKIVKGALPLNHFVKKVYFDEFFPEFDKFDGGQNITNETIFRAIQTSMGMKGTIETFEPTDVYQALVKEEILLLKPLIMACTHSVKRKMEKAIATSHHPDALKRYKNLTNKITAVTSNFINQCFAKCVKHFEDYLNAEASIAYSADPNFIQEMTEQRDKIRGIIKKSVEKKESTNVVEKLTFKAVSYGAIAASRPAAIAVKVISDTVETISEVKTEPEATSSSNPSEHENDKEYGKLYEENFKIIRAWIKLYYGQVKWNIKNYVPNGISQTLVYAVGKRLEDDLMAEVYDPQDLDYLVEESSNLTAERKEATEALMKYKEAMEICDKALAFPQ